MKHNKFHYNLEQKKLLMFHDDERSPPLKKKELKRFFFVIRNICICVHAVLVVLLLREIYQCLEGNFLVLDDHYFFDCRTSKKFRCESISP